MKSFSPYTLIYIKTAVVLKELRNFAVVVFPGHVISNLISIE